MTNRLLQMVGELEVLGRPELSDVDWATLVAC